MHLESGDQKPQNCLVQVQTASHLGQGAARHDAQHVGQGNDGLARAILVHDVHAAEHEVVQQGAGGQALVQRASLQPEAPEVCGASPFEVARMRSCHAPASCVPLRLQLPGRHPRLAALRSPVQALGGQQLHQLSEGGGAGDGVQAGVGEHGGDQLLHGLQQQAEPVEVEEGRNI